MQFRNRKIRVHLILNYTFLTTLVLYISIHALLSIISQLTQLTTRIPVQPTDDPNSCNGHPLLCERKYSNITHIGTHDAPFIGILPMENQNVDIPTQLDAGIRFLQAQTHRNAFGKLSLCHTACLMKDAGLLSDYLIVVKEWLDAHPREVITLLLTNGDNVPISDFASAFEKSGIIPHAYIPPSTSSLETTNDNNNKDTWPTLSHLIAQKTRLITFLDTGAEPSPSSSSQTNPSEKPPYILHEFTHYWETPFITTDPHFPSCIVHRPTGIASSPAKIAQRMYIINHFLQTRLPGLDVEVPNRRDAARTNSWASISGHVERCAALYGGRKPSVVLVDYFERGGAVDVGRRLNGLL